MKFRRGNTYLGKRKGYWYIVQQLSLRQWVATIFTHVVFYEGLPVGTSKQCNAIEMSELDWDEVYEFNSTPELRRAMFNILKTGKAGE